jgi:hypothetical protein
MIAPQTAVTGLNDKHTNDSFQLLTSAITRPAMNVENH